MRNAILISAGCLLAAGLAGCAANPATGGRDLVLMSEEDEIRVGHQAAAEVAREYERYDHAALQDYVQAVGEKLAAVGERPELDYSFTVLDSEEVNAFALPGGHIYIARGLLAYLNSEAELAAVLGHEIAHVTARHAVRAYGTSAVTNVLGGIAAAATGLPGTDIVTGMLGEVLVRGYGRNLELEADQLGAVYLARAGYSPDAVIDVLSVLKDQDDFERQRAEEEGRTPRTYHGVFATHPSHDTRLREVVASAGDLEVASQAVENRFTYLHFLDGVVYGANRPNPGGRVGEYLNPAMGLALQLPIGWRVESSARSVKAKSPNEDGMLQLSVQDVSRREHPREFLLRRLGQDAKILREEEFTSAGLPGYAAVALRAPSPYGERAVRYGLVYMGRQVLVFAGAAQSLSDPYRFDREILSAIRSVRPLTTQEKRAAAPAVIRVLQAEPGMTVEQLAGASRLTKHAQEHIRLINALYPDGEPTPGEYIKTLE